MTLAGSSGPASIQTGSNEDQHQVRSYHKFAALAAPSSLIDQEEQRTRGSSSSFITSPPDWLRSLPEEISVENSTRRPANEAQRLNGSAAATTMTASAPGTPTGETNSQPVPVTVIELTIFQAIESHYLRHSPSVSMIMIIGYTIVFLVGIVGNSFVVAIVCKSPRMRTVTNYFIVNLALADILVLLFCLPATLVGNLFIRKYQIFKREFSASQAAGWILIHLRIRQFSDLISFCVGQKQSKGFAWPTQARWPETRRAGHQQIPGHPAKANDAECQYLTLTSLASKPAANSRNRLQ